MNSEDNLLRGEEKREEALNFLKNHRAGVIATLSSKGHPQASLIFYVAQDDFSIYFLTLSSSRKYLALMEHPEVAFTVTAHQVPQTLQIEGVVEKLNPLDMPTVLNLLEVLTADSKNYPPVAKMGQPGADILRIRPTWIRWGDFTKSGEGEDKVFYEIRPVVLK